MTAPERRRGQERRDPPPGRPIYSRGPIIRGLEILSALSGLVAVVALIVSLTSQSNRIDALQISRMRAAEDSCFLLRGLVFAAAPPHALDRARNYINATALRDCSSYGRKVILTP